MANIFKNSITGSIGTSSTIAYQTPPSTVSTLIGLNIANTTPGNVNFTVELVDSSSSKTASLIKNAILPGYSSTALVGGDQKIVMEENDYLTISSNINSSIDAIISVLEIT